MMLHEPVRSPLLRRAAGALGALALLLPALAAAAAGAPDGAAERWFALELDGRAAGWAVERWWSEDGRTVTESELTLRLTRGNAGIEVELAGRFEETADGEPLLLWIRQALGSAPIETTYRFTPGAVVAESAQAGRRHSEQMAVPPGDWLTPAEARRAVAAHHAAGDAEYSVRAVAPLEGLEPVTVRRVRLGPPPDGVAPGAVGRWREEASAAPGVESIVDLDAAGEVVRSATELLGLEATLRRVDRESALAAAAGPDGDDWPPEVLATTLVRPDRPIPEAREVRVAVYDLSLDSPDSLERGKLPDLPSEGAQRVERRGDRLRVTVTAGEPEPAAPPRSPDADPVPGSVAAVDPGGPELLAPSLYLDHQDPEVRRLLDLAVPADDEPARLARVLATFVHGYVEAKGLDTGFATASEVARTRRGDCTEHAVLLVALLRGAGIPARAVTGLVYLDEFAGAEEVFGYHMWVQAHVDDRWLDLDPTLPWGFDATHVALAVSDLAGPDGGAAFERMLPLVGKLAIEVVALER